MPVAKGVFWPLVYWLDGIFSPPDLVSSLNFDNVKTMKTSSEFAGF